MLVCYIYIQLKTFKIEKELDKMTCCNYLCRIVCSCEVTCIAQTSPQIQNIRWLVFMMCCDCYLCEIVCTYQAFSSDYCDHIQKERSSKSPRVWAPQWPGLATPCLQVLTCSDMWSLIELLDGPIYDLSLSEYDQRSY